jgi:hypothetical protein
MCSGWLPSRANGPSPSWDRYSAPRRGRTVKHFTEHSPTALFPKLSVQDKEFCWFLADSFARIGETDQALHWTGNAIDRGFANARFWSEADPFSEPLRGDRRFQVLAERARDREHAPDLC